MRMSGKSELPEGWISAAIPEFCEINPSKPKRGCIPADTPVSFIPMPAVDAESGIITKPEIRKFADVRDGFTFFQEGDIIFAKITPCMENGKAAIARNLINGLGFGSTEFITLKLNEVIPEYLYYYIRQESFRKEAEANMTGSVGQKRVPKRFIEDTIIPLAPLAEQSRIVAALGALLGRIDPARKRLDRAQLLLTKYKQAILTAAFNGSLTAGWRKAHPDVDPMERLPNEVDGFELPEKWTCTILKSICEDITDGDHQPPPQSVEGIPFLVISNIREGKLDFNNTRFVSHEYYESIPRIKKPSEGDVLYSLVGSYGIPVIVNTKREFCFQRHIGLIRPSNLVSTEYLYYFLKSDLAFRQATKVATGTAQMTVPLNGLRKFKIPLPPPSELHVIVRRIEILFTLADNIEKRVAAGKDQVDRLPQTILAKAFSGQLVSTEAELARKEGREYEPASILLERIRKGGRLRRKMEER